VVFTMGYRNRFGFPHPEVRQRYRQRGSRELLTGDQGAISITLYPGQPIAPQGWRSHQWRWWRSAPDKEMAEL
jgi:competence protein ComEC